MQHDVEFSRFRRRREYLNSRLDDARAKLDVWIDQYSEANPPPAQLATLQGLLQIRSDLFAQIKELDDRFLDYLLSRRQVQPAPPENPETPQAR